MKYLLSLFVSLVPGSPVKPQVSAFHDGGCAAQLIQSKTKIDLEGKNSETLTHVSRRALDWVNKKECLSCHTVLPIAFIPGFATSLEGQSTYQSIRSYVESRAQNFTGVKPWYGVTSSPATESVISALLIASAEGGEAASTLLKTTIENMLELQDENGSWTWLDMGLEPFESGRGKLFGNAMAAHALARAGAEIVEAPRTIAAIESLKKYLRGQVIREDLNRFDIATLLWAEQALPGLLDHATEQKFIGSLVEIQNNDGGFSTASFEVRSQRRSGHALSQASDSFATSYILTAIGKQKATASPGLLARYNMGLDWLGKNRSKDGYFNAPSINFSGPRDPGFMTDFASALSLAILQ